jgi:hypothetical protein
MSGLAAATLAPLFKVFTASSRRTLLAVKSDASREQLEALCAYVQKTAPVLDIITNAVPVTISLQG